MITTTVDSAVSEPISTGDAKAYLHITHDLENDLVAALVSAARSHCERYTGLLLAGQSVTQTMDRFPCGGTLILKKGPVSEVSSINVVNPDAEGGMAEFSAANYIVDPASRRIVLKDGASWPDVVQSIAGIKVSYTTSGDVPAQLIQGMKHLIAHMYENRETADQIPPVVAALWSSYREVVV
jgi:uncharacterized phiE125 gp8 family phage protein